MLKSRKQIRIVIGSISALMLVVILGIVYSAFTGQLSINGEGTVRKSDWNIHFVGEGEIEPSNELSSSVKVLSKPSISNTTIGEYSVSLTTPGDSISYSFSIINEGDYNAKISNFNLPSPVCKVNGSQGVPDATKVCQQLRYELKYSTGETVTSNDTLLSKETKTMILTLTYQEFDNANVLPNNDVAISNLGFTINYVQDGNVIVNNDGSTPLKTYTVGQELTVKGDKYNILSVGSDYVTLLKQEPLTLDEVDEYGAGHINRYTSSNVGTVNNHNGYGGMAYYTSETCGWINGSWTDSGCTTEYEQSEVKYVVDAWARAKFTNNELAIDTKGYKARLITISELEGLGYEKTVDYEYLVNDNIPTWVYNTQFFYWTMSSYDSSTRVWYVYRDGNVRSINMNDDFIFYESSIDYDGEVRPVINVYKSFLN